MKHQNIHCYAIAFLLLVAIIPANSLKAQSEFGIKGGALYSGLKLGEESYMFDFQNSSGFSLGAFYTKNNLVGPIGLQMELLYQMKGANIYIQQPSIPTPGNGETEIAYWFQYYRKRSILASTAPVTWDRHQERYHYFSLPILLTFQPAKFLDIYSGVELGYMFAKTNIYSSNLNHLMLGEPNRFSASWVAGAKVRLGDKTKLDFRYSGNLVPLYEIRNTDIKDHSFSISIEQSLWRK
jgi:opacity protein-like surface antigen